MKIFCAAIRDEESGIVCIGKQHHICIATMIDCGFPAPINGEQGFITDEGEFVSRTEAYFIARDAKQIKRKHGNSGTLYSEDIL